jgi:phage shock protein PspC (stress-responsive transcriptional regulator)
MQKVIAINLNGNAFQLEETGYDALVAYLSQAEAQLKDNPDRAEITADLEQAVGEKCRQFLGPHKSVVTAAEIDQVIKEMGPVDGGQSAETGTEGAAPRADASGTDAASGAKKRLYQIPEGKMISGVCNGLAAYFDVDVTIVRIVFVLLAILTKGLWVLVYLVMMFVIPYATTSEERAAAAGVPFNAQQLIDQAKKNYAEFKGGKPWRWHWRRQQRQWRRQWRQGLGSNSWWDPDAPSPVPYAAQVLTGVIAPVLALAHLGLFLLLAYAMYTVGTTQSLIGWPLPSDVPVWAAMLVLVIAYQIVAAPLAFARHASRYAFGGRRPELMDTLGGFMWMAAVVTALWVGYHYVPALREFLQRMAQLARTALHSGA